MYGKYKEIDGLIYTVGKEGKIRKTIPWLGDLFSGLYDRMMRRSVFPRKFGSDYEKHSEIIRRELADLHGARIIEIGTGSGISSEQMKNDNRYTGVDISPRLLKIAGKRLRDQGFNDYSLYVVRADELPFTSEKFDFGLCVLTLNFLPDFDRSLCELFRVLKPGSSVLFCVPVPERKPDGSIIRGNLFTEEELRIRLNSRGFRFEPLAHRNGALLYFKAMK